MKKLATDYLVYDEATKKYSEDPEQAVRDDVEKHYWLNVGRTILKDWRLYLMLVPMLLVFLFWRYFPMYELLGCFKIYDSTKDDFDYDLNYDEKYCTQLIKPRTPKESKKINRKIYFADFETDPTAEYHIPFMVVLQNYNGDEIKTFKGTNCGEDLLNYLSSLSFEDNEQIFLDKDGNECVKRKYVDKDGNEKEGYFYLDNDQPMAGSPSAEKLEYKPGYYYMRTLLNTLRDYTFRRELKSGNDDVWVYQYSNADHDEAYALWCPTSNMTKVDGYKLYVGTDYESVTLVESDAENAKPEGKTTELTVDANGFVSVNVSENPVYVVVNK